MTRRTGDWAVMAEQVTGRGASGVVCAAAPLAAQAGAAAMRDGGNAFDAVVAAALAETVLLPPKCGLGGDLVALILEPGEPEPHSILAIGGAPAGLAGSISEGTFDDTGPCSVGPPAAAAGYLALADRAVLALDRLASPAISLATDGFPWASVCTRLQRASIDLVRRWNPGGSIYFPDDDVIPAGTLVRLPGLARALTELVEREHGFLAGPVGDAIVETVAAHGGVLTANDLAHATAERAECQRDQVAGRPLWTTPAPTHGPSLADAVRHTVPGARPDAVFASVLAAIRRRRADLADPRSGVHDGTSMVSATDRSGRVVVVIHSNSYPRFGSGLIVDEFDLVLANRAGRGFTPVDGHPNFPVAGRRPATTLHAWMIGDADGTPRLAGGTPGGANQMPWNAQTIQDIVDGETSPGALVTSPRWEWLPSDDGVRIEAGIADDDAASLGAAASRTVRTGRWGFTSAQQVVAVARPGHDLDQAVVGAADPRTVGSALGV